MQNRKSSKLSTAMLVLLFMTGLVLSMWPTALQLIAYRADDNEYREMAAELHIPMVSPDADLSEPDTALTIAPTKRITVHTDTNPTNDRLDEQLLVSPTPDQSTTEQPTMEYPSSIPPACTSAIKVRPPAASPPVTTIPLAIAMSPMEPTVNPTSSNNTILETYLAQNKDFVAWLTIPDTKIDYPVVRSNNTEYYLHHLFSGKESKLGCLFSLKSSDYRTPSKNIAIYGHHLSNNTAMFSTLVKYKDQSYYSTHSTIQLNTLYGTRSYKIFAVLNMNVSDWDAATASFSSNEAFVNFVERARKAALYETGVKVGASDHILTLITCDRSYDGVSGRLIVMAVEQN